MNPESEIDQRTMSYADVVKVLLSIGNVRAAFINCMESELLLVTRNGFKISSLEILLNKLPLWIQNGCFPNDPNISYSFTCTKICRFRTIEIEGSPLRAKLMYPGIEKIL